MPLTSLSQKKSILIVSRAAVSVVVAVHLMIILCSVVDDEFTVNYVSVFSLVTFFLPHLLKVAVRFLEPLQLDTFRSSSS